LHVLRGRAVAEPAPIAAAGNVSEASHVVGKQVSAGSSLKPDKDIVARKEEAPAASSWGRLSDPERERAAQRQISSAFMRRYDDPAQREEMLLEAKGQLRRGVRPFANIAGMSDAELDAFVNLLAEQQLERRVAEHRCGMSESCDYLAHRFTDVDRHRAEITALIGADTYQKYRQFREAGQERSLVSHLRVKLVDVEALRSSDAERLITALFEEREQFFAQAARKNVQLVTMSTGLGMVVTKAGEPGEEGEVDEHTREFNEIARARAATILTREQLRVFSEIQDEAYRSIEGSLRSQKEMEAARAAQARQNTNAPSTQGQGR
jgi:hypothetical protein